ncbi:MAG: hypothetical protein ACYC1K_02935 [Minisyncoccota bacterium]
MNPEQPIEENSSSPLKQIRTFQGDVASALHKQNESLVSIQRSEHAVREARKVFATPKSPEEIAKEESNKKLIFLLIGSLILIILSGLIGWYAYKGYMTKTALPVVEQTPNKLLISSSEVKIDASRLSREAFILGIGEERAKKISDGTIVHIQLEKPGATTTTPLTTGDLLNLLESRAPGSLIRSLNPVFMLGLLGSGPSSNNSGVLAHTFVLIKLDSFSNAYPGMLEWEKSMRDDILPIFTTPETLATTSPTALFSDVTLQNKDARILKDFTGQTVLIYSFFDNNMLIITDNETSLRALVGKLNAEKLSR